MSNLKEATKAVAEAWRKAQTEGLRHDQMPGGLLNQLLAAWDATESLVEPTERPTLIARAREEYAMGSDDNIEVDDNADFSPGDGGCWVSAWVWLPNEEKDD